MENENRKPTDEELVTIVSKLLNGEFETEEESDAALNCIEKAYPCANFIELFKRNLTPEQVLEEAKKAKPIYL